MHVVTFTNAEGKAGTHQTESLEEAIKFIEHIRNSESVNDAKLYNMVEIPIEVKAYYKVEIGGPGEQQAPATPAANTLPPIETNSAPTNTPVR